MLCRLRFPVPLRRVRRASSNGNLWLSVTIASLHYDTTAGSRLSLGSVHSSGTMELIDPYGFVHEVV
jgi:hypothetical protein